jgi:hypothetical protein
VTFKIIELLWTFEHSAIFYSHLKKNWFTHKAQISIAKNACKSIYICITGNRIFWLHTYSFFLKHLFALFIRFNEKTYMENFNWIHLVNPLYQKDFHDIFNEQNGREEIFCWICVCVCVWVGVCKVWEKVFFTVL